MTITDRQLAGFFKSIGSFSAGYVESDFRYLAAKTHDGLQLLKGRIYLRPERTPSLPPKFETPRFVAGAFALEAKRLTVEDFANGLISGVIDTPEGTFKFSRDGDTPMATAFSALHEEGLRNQNRLPVFIAGGGFRKELMPQPETDWEIMGAETPYNGLQELLMEYGLGYFEDNRCWFEIAAHPVIRVAPRSKVDGKTANIAVDVAAKLDQSGASIGIRVVSGGAVISRKLLGADDLNWSQSENWHHGECNIDVPEASVVQCFASYDRQAHHFWWIADPAFSANPKRVAYESMDAGFAILQDFLSKQPGKGNARDLETGVSWLLWMLGFSVAHLGSTAKTQEAVDVIATTPTGHFAVIECTTGLLKANNKLPLVVSRAAELRERLARLRQQHLRVLPVIVTSKSRAEIVAELDQAAQHHVFVVTQETLLEALRRTMLQPDPERLYAEAEQSVRSAQSLTIPEAIQQ